MKMEYKLLDNGVGVILTRQPEIVEDELFIDFADAPADATAIFETKGGNSYYRLLSDGLCSLPVKKIIGDEKPITHRPADDLSPELEKLRTEIAQYIEQDEDVLSYALFPEVSKKFFEYRKAKKYQLDAEHADKMLGVHTI